jgi:UDP-glucose 4-epimerase
MMTTILITGAAGLIGSCLADWILETQPNVSVIGIDDLSGGYIENVDSRVIFYQTDLVSDVSHIFETHKPDIVYHFAAYAAECLSPFIRKFNYINNLVITSGIVSECVKHNVKRLVFTSSMSVYGEGIPPFNESQPRCPIDPYGVAKSGCEMDIEIAGKQHGLDWCIIRPHNFYGPKQNIWDSYRNVLGIWMYKRLNDQPLTIFGDGEQVRAFSYIDDAMPAFWKAGIDVGCSKEIINLGGIHSVSIKESAQALLEITGGSDLIYLPPRHEVKHAVPTYQKSIDLLGFEHKTSMKEGLEKMWAWAKTQPKRPRQIWSEYELESGLYPFWEKDTLTSQAPNSILLSK